MDGGRDRTRVGGAYAHWHRCGCIGGGGGCCGEVATYPGGVAGGVLLVPLPYYRNNEFGFLHYLLVLFGSVIVRSIIKCIFGLAFRPRSQAGNGNPHFPVDVLSRLRS